MSVYREQAVVDTPVGRTTAVARTRRFSPGQLLSGCVGLVLVVLGIIAVTRTGVDSTLNTPVTNVVGLTQSALVGFIELGAGLLLLIGSADAAFRGAAGFVGALLLVGGIVVAASTAKLLLDLGTSRSTGWFAVVLGAVAILGSLLPTVLRSDRTVASDRF
jgi:hypothetical protein